MGLSRCLLDAPREVPEGRQCCSFRYGTPRTAIPTTRYVTHFFCLRSLASIIGNNPSRKKASISIAQPQNLPDRTKTITVGEFEHGANKMKNRQHLQVQAAATAPSHFFSNSNNSDTHRHLQLLSEKQSQWWHQASSSTGMGMAYNNMPLAASELHHIHAARRHREEELMRLRRMGEDAAAALAHRRMLPPMGSGRILPMMVGVRSKEDNDSVDGDVTTLCSESIEHIIALQEEQVRHDTEIEQLRQLEFIRAVNQRGAEEEMMLAEQHHHFRSRQLYHHLPPHGAGGRNASGDEGMRELLSRVGTQLPCGESSLSQLQGGFQLDRSDDSSICLGGATHPPQSADVSVEGAAAAPVRHNFRQSPPYNSPPSRSNTGAPPPPMRYWNNGVEVDIRGVPVASSPLNKLNSSNSATSTTVARITSSASTLDLDDNIISQFSTLVMSCAPEVNSAISNLLSDVMRIRGFPSDPLIVHSKFPVFVEAALIELKSLGERSKDKTELHARVTNCVAAIEPYKNVTELDAPSVYSQIREIVEEGMGLASGLLVNDPSARRSEKRKKKKKERKRKRKGSDDKEKDSSESKKAKTKRRKPSRSESDTVTILEMYKKRKSEVGGEVETNISKQSLTLTSSKKAKKESSGSHFRVKSDDRNSNAKEVKRTEAPSSPMVSNSSSSDTTTTQTLKKRHISDPSKHPHAKSKSIVEQGPHGNLLQQIFGKGNSGGGDGDTSSSTNVNAAGVATAIQAASDQKKADDNTVISVANVLLGLGGGKQ